MMGIQQSRTEHIVKNVSIVMLTRVVTLLLSFVSRTIFIYLLGKEYLGIDGLFSSILNIFSLAELGIGSALIYSLYTPIANNDLKKTRQILTLYKKAYQYIYFFILFAGLCLLPFIKRIVNADLNTLGVNVYIVFILFLFRTLSSYFLAHKQATLLVNQQQRVISICQTAIQVLVYILECCVLLIYNNYYLFLLIGLAGNYGTALLISYIANKKYPLLKREESESLSIEEIQQIKKNVYALFLRRLGGVVYASTNNLVINSFISLAVVGVYSNYVLIINSIQSITNQSMSAMTASIGNFVSTNNKNDVEQAFYLFTFITYIVYGFCCICLILITNNFILLLWGEEYLLSNIALFLIVLNFAFYGFQNAINIFRDTTGLFVQGKYRGLISAGVNVVTAIVFVQFWGIEGVLLGTITARLLVSVWYDPYILYRDFFNGTPFKYYWHLVIYVVYPFFIAGIVDFSIRNFTCWGNNLLISIVSAVLVLPMLIFPFIKTREYYELKKRIQQYIVLKK